MNFKQKLTTGLATGTALASMFSTVAFAADVDVSGNVLTSTSVHVVESNTTSVEQNNSQHVVNVVNASSNTGGNSSSFNVGGGAVVTGAATTNVTNTTTAGNNTAIVAGCGCASDPTSVTVGGNVLSSVHVGVFKVKSTSYTQNSSQGVLNLVNAKSNTGKNKVMFTVGGGVIGTGPARTNVTNTVTGGSNGLVVTP